jgi:hypothetical protein
MVCSWQIWRILDVCEEARTSSGDGPWQTSLVNGIFELQRKSSINLYESSTFGVSENPSEMERLGEFLWSCLGEGCWRFYCTWPVVVTTNMWVFVSNSRSWKPPKYSSLSSLTNKCHMSMCHKKVEWEVAVMGINGAYYYHSRSVFQPWSYLQWFCSIVDCIVWLLYCASKLHLHSFLYIKLFCKGPLLWTWPLKDEVFCIWNLIYLTLFGSPQLPGSPERKKKCV